MLQRAVALLLQRLLGKFVSFDSSMLRLSLWQGDLSFQDLQLRLPYGEGTIGQFSVNIPWRALWTQPVIIKAQQIRVLLHQTPATPADHLEKANSFGLDESDGGEVIDNNTGDGACKLWIHIVKWLSSYPFMCTATDRTYLSRLVTHIISNVQIELTDVQIRYDCTETALAPVTHPKTRFESRISTPSTNPFLSFLSAIWELYHGDRVGHADQHKCAMGARVYATVQLAHGVEKGSFAAFAELRGIRSQGRDEPSVQLLKIDRVAAYVEYADSASSSVANGSLSSQGMQRKYLLHDWYSTVKVCMFRVTPFVNSI